MEKERVQQDNTTILKKIHDAHTQSSEIVDEIKETRRYLVFLLETTAYAVEAEYIREIINDSQRYFVPFTPTYIQGFLNRHGEPYSILDLSVLFGKEALNTRTFLIFEAEQLAIPVSQVVEITQIEIDSVQHLTASDPNENFFHGSVDASIKSVLVIDLEQVMKHLEEDLNV